MKIAYLVNQHPKISHTFIRREIEALEHEGIAVDRYTLRRTVDTLVTPADQEEARLTHVILDAGAVGLLLSLLRSLLTRPAGFFAALALSVRLSSKSERGLLINLVYLAEACVLARGLQKSGVTHVHAHFGTNATAVAMLCRSLIGSTYSFTIHGPEEFDKPDPLHLREKIEAADSVFAVSSFGRSQVFRHCGYAHWPKVQIVRCGVDSSFLDAAPVAVSAAPTLVSVGRLSEQKGQMLLIDALGELHRRGRDFQLTLIGDGELRAPIERAIAQHGIGNKVKLAGWANEATIREEIVKSRAMILPSFAEGLPVVIMEALALCRPVVSTYVAGIPELVETGKNGWLVPAGSVPHLVTALEQVLDATPEQLFAFGQEGRTRVLAQHDTRKIGPQIAELTRQRAARN